MPAKVLIIEDEAVRRMKQALRHCGADIITSFYRRGGFLRKTERHPSGDLILDGIKDEEIAGPCCVATFSALRRLAVDHHPTSASQFGQLYRASLLAGQKLEVIPEVLFRCRRTL